MPKPTKEEISAKISQLEEELRNYPEELFLNDEDYEFHNNSGSGPDADFFDIEIEPTKKAEGKFWKGETKRGRGQFFLRGKSLHRGRARGKKFFRGMFRGKYVSSFIPQDSKKQSTQNLYNEDEVDWSRYVSQNLGRDEKQKDGLSQFSAAEGNASTSKFIRKDNKDKKKGLESKDMFYFPNEGADKKCTIKPSSIERAETLNVTQNKEVNKTKPETQVSNLATSDVLSIFQELQSKLSSSGEDIPGFDILAETLKKITNLKETTKTKTAANEERHMVTSTSSKSQRHLNITNKEPSPMRKVVYTHSSKPKDGSSLNKHDSFSSEKRDDHRREETPPRKRNISPHRKRSTSPHGKREVPSYKRRSPVSPSRKRLSPPPRRRRSPSPFSRRRRTPTPPFRRRYPSGSPPRRRDSDSPPTKRRESDLYFRRSPKRRRSRSRSPRKDSYHRSSSRSPRRSDYRKRRGSDSPITISPSPDRSGNNWNDVEFDKLIYQNKQDYLVSIDPLQQPVPPGGDTSDVYAEVIKTVFNNWGVRVAQSVACGADN